MVCIIDIKYTTRICTKCGTETIWDDELNCNPLCQSCWDKRIDGPPRKRNSNYRKRQIERVRLWKQNNRERFREWSREYYQKNKEHITELSRKRYAESVKVREYQQQYYQKNKEHLKELTRKRYAEIVALQT